MTEILSASYLISLNGRTLSDTPGVFTRHPFNGSSTVGSSAVSWALSDKITYFKVQDQICFPHHCPIQLFLEIGDLVEEEIVNVDGIVDLDQAVDWVGNWSNEFLKFIDQRN